MQECKICGKFYKAITNTHLFNKHNFTVQEYLKQFPNEKIGIMNYCFKKGNIPWDYNLILTKKNYYTRPGYYEKTRLEAFERDNNKCCQCDSRDNLIVHHLVPVKENGWNSLENLKTLCKSCHGKLHKYKVQGNYFLRYETTFDSAHKLNNYEGICKNIHGHTWKLQIVIQSDDLDKTGMIVDFHDIKEVYKEILAGIDHQFLNDELDFNPTAENLACYFYYMFKYYFWNLKEVTIWESPEASITYTGEKE